MNTAAAQPATFNRPKFNRAAQHGRGLIAKIHVGKKMLAMDEDDYRVMLFEVTGQTSLTRCTERQLEAVVTRLKSKGFKPLPTAGRHPAATHKVAGKARALWISLHQLGVVHNPSEHALEAFARRQLKCDTFSWANQREGFRLIEALKSMANRNGWRQTSLVSQKALTPFELQQSLCHRIVDRLKAAGAIPADWSLDQAAWKLAGIDTADCPSGYGIEDYARLAKTLGKRLRDALPAGTGAGEPA